MTSNNWKKVSMILGEKLRAAETRLKDALEMKARYKGYLNQTTRTLDDLHLVLMGAERENSGMLASKANIVVLARNIVLDACSTQAKVNELRGANTDLRNLLARAVSAPTPGGEA
jgi:hypothetical protein